MSRSPNQANQEKQTKNQKPTNNNNLSQSISNQNSMMESQNNPNKGNQQSQNDKQPQTNQPVYPVRPYLERNLVPIVQQALVELDKVRPDDPLEYLGKYLISKAQNN